MCIPEQEQIGLTRRVSMQRDPVVSKASELLRLGLMPTPSKLREGKVC